MDTPARSARTNKALQVVKRTNEGLTVVNACKEIGIPRSSFYSIYKRNPQILMEFHEMVEAKERMELALLITNGIAVLEKVIEAGVADTTKPRERLAILKFINTRMEELLEKLRIDSNDEDIKKILSGPVLKPGVSRFSTSESPIINDADPEEQLP